MKNMLEYQKLDLELARMKKSSLNSEDRANLAKLKNIILDYHGKGFKLEDDAKTLLYASIEKLRKNKYFDGYKTIKMLCQDIIYYVFSSEEGVAQTISANMLNGFSQNSEYVNRMIGNIERTNKIGYFNKG